MAARVLVFVADDGASDVEAALRGRGLEPVRATSEAGARAALAEGIAGAVVDDALGEAAWPVARAAACPVLLLYAPNARARALEALGRRVADVCARGAADEVGARMERLVGPGARDSDRLRALGLVVHDLNNPLAAIRILAEMLEADLDDPSLRRDLRDVLEATDAAAALAESLGAMLRLERGHRPLSRAPVDLREIARKAAERPCYAPHAVMAPGPAAPVDVDPEAVAQAVSDVLLTARRLAPEGSQVRIEVQAPATLVISSAGAVPAAAVERLLEPYGSVDARSQRVPVGALGLAYARWVADAHGGRLEVRGEPSFEARFALPT